MESGRGSLPSSPQSRGLTSPYKSGLYFSPIGRVGPPKEDETCGSPSPVKSFGQHCLFPVSRTDEVTKPQSSSVTIGAQCGAMTQASSKAKPIPVVQSHRPPLPSHYITHNQEAAVRLPSPPCPKTVVPFPNWTPLNPVGCGQWNPWGGQPSKVITYPNRNLISLSPTRHGSSLPLPTPKTPSQSPAACGTRNGLSQSTTMSTTPRTMSTPTTNTMSPTTNTMSATLKTMWPTPKTMPTIPKILSKSSAACSPLLSPAQNSPSSFTSNPKTLSQTSSAACSAYLSPNARPSPPLSSKPYSPLLSPRPTPSLSSKPYSPLLSPRPTPSLSSKPYSPLLSPRPTPSLSSNPESPLLSPRPSPPLSSNPGSPLLSPRPSPPLSSLLNPLTRPSPPLSSKPYSSLLNPLTRPSPPLFGDPSRGRDPRVDNPSSKPYSPLLSPRPTPSLSSNPESPLLSPRPTPSLSSNPESPLLSPRPTPSLSSNPYSPLLSPRPNPPLSSNLGSPLLSPRPSPPLSSKTYSPLLSPRPSPPLSSKPYSPLRSPLTRPSPPLTSKPYSPLLSPLTRPSPPLSSLLNPLTRPSPSLSSKPYSSLLNPLTRPSPSLSPSTSHSPLLTPTRQGMMSPSSTACKPSLSPLPRWPVVGHQDCASKHHKDNASNEESVPGGSTFLSMKRSRESEYADISAKKLCVQDQRCVPPARSPVCTSAGQSLSPSSLAPKPSPSNVLSPKTAHGRLHTAPASGRSPCSALKQKLVQTKLSVSPPSETLARQSSSPLARLYLSPPPKNPLTRHQYVSPKLTPPLNRLSLSQTRKFTVTRPPSPHPPNSPFNRLPWSPTPKSPLTSMSLSPTPKSPLTSMSLSPTPKSPLTRQAVPQPQKSPVTKLSLPQMPDFPLTPRALSQPPKSPATKLFLSQPPRPSASGVMPLAFTVKQSDKRSTDGPKDGSLNSWIAKCKRKVDDEGPPCPPLASTVAQKESKPKVKYQRRDDTKLQVRYRKKDDTEVLVKYQRRADTKGETSTRGQERQGTDRTSTKLKPNAGYVGRLSLKHKRPALGGHMTYDIFNCTPDSIHKPENTATGREKSPPATHKESCGSDSDRVADSGTFRVGSQCGVTLQLMPKLQRMAVVILDRVDLENMRLKRGGVFPSGPFFASSLRQRSGKRRTSSRKKNPRLLFQSDAPKEDTDTASKRHSDMPLRTSPRKKSAQLCQSVVPKKEDTACSDSAMPPHGSPDTPGVVCAERAAKTQADEDPLDLEVGMSFEMDMKLSQSSSSSSSSSCEEEEEEEEEEQMRSMRELMDRITSQTAMPEPEHSNTHLVSSKMVHYKNTLDQTLLHITNTIESKANESRLLEDCKVDLLSEEAEDEQEDAISAEQREFLQRYALAPSSMRDVHPGEEVFHLDSAGRIFSQDSLQLAQCNATPQGTMQTTLLCSGPFQFRKHLRVDLPTSAYSSYPCPPDATRFLFKLMSVHKENMAATLILNSLNDIAIAAAEQRVRNGCQQFAVWVPSISEITLVFMNMGVPFVGLYPNESLQPAFTEGDVLEGIHIGSESPSSSGEPRAFPLHNFNYVLEYLDFCTRLCPCAYDDAELLLLLTVLCRLSLDVELVLQPLGKLHCLLESVVSNVSDWDAALPRMCAALVGLTADHHNMCSLVSKLPLHDRGQELRRHLSMCMISTLLDGSCTYQPAVGEFQLSALRDFLPCMRPSTLLHGLRQNASGPSQDDDQDSLDMQSYYLCNSLLTLLNEASNLQFYTTQQKEQLLGLCSELEFHVKSHIRESEKCLYRSTVKDLVARIYTRWQMLLLRTRPLNGQLYDYWKPVRMGSQSSAEGEEEPPIPEEEVEQEEMMEEDVVEEEEEEMEEEEEEEENERAGQQG